MRQQLKTCRAWAAPWPQWLWKHSGCDHSHPSSDPWKPSLRRCIKYLLTSEHALKLSLAADGVYFVISVQQLSDKKCAAVQSGVSVSLQIIWNSIKIALSNRGIISCPKGKVKLSMMFDYVFANLFFINGCIC